MFPASREEDEKDVSMFDMSAGLLVFHIVAIVAIFAGGYVLGARSRD